MAQQLPARSLSAGPIQVQDSVGQVPASAWDDLTGPDDLFFSRRWLRIAEATSAVPMRYLLSRDDEGLAGVRRRYPRGALDSVGVVPAGFVVPAGSAVPVSSGRDTRATTT
jgi:hypothetical protein